MTQIVRNLINALRKKTEKYTYVGSAPTYCTATLPGTGLRHFKIKIRTPITSALRNVHAKFGLIFFCFRVSSLCVTDRRTGESSNAAY